VLLLDGVTGKVIRKLNHSSWVFGLEFSPDSRRLVTGSHDQTAILWDAATGETTLRLPGADEPIADAHFLQDGRFVMLWTESGRMRLHDATSGDALTPWAEVGERSSLHPVTAVHPQRLIVAGGMSRGLRIHEFVTPSRRADDLLEEARVVAGRSHPGAESALAPAELLARHGAWQRERGPRFETIRHLQADWHAMRLENLAANWSCNAAGAERHLQSLIELEPKRAGLNLDEVRRRLDRLRIPPRLGSTPTNLIDLSDHYTASLDSTPDGDFAELPRGVQRLAGTEFDIRGIVRLTHALGADATGERVSYLRVAQRCRKLHFLFATEGGPEVKSAVACRFEVNYADFGMHPLTMLYGRDILAHWFQPEQKRTLRDGVVAWEGHCAAATRIGATVRLYKVTWTNYQPETEIRFLEMKIGEVMPRPILVAITAE
jgi:hypothetical protein